MLPGYHRAVLGVLLSTAAVVGEVLSRMFAPLYWPLCTCMSVIVAVVATHKLDHVSERFKTDVERILEPNKATDLTMKRLFAASLAAGWMIGLIWAPAIAAPLALMLMFCIMKKGLQ